MVPVTQKREAITGQNPSAFPDENSLTRELLDTWPDAIVNCSAISSPDLVSDNPEYARSINVQGAIRLAEIASHLGARYLHISTDMVFDGTLPTLQIHRHAKSIERVWQTKARCGERSLSRNR